MNYLTIQTISGTMEITDGFTLKNNTSIIGGTLVLVENMKIIIPIFTFLPSKFFFNKVILSAKLQLNH